MENMKETPENKCREINDKFEAYINGTLTEVEAAEIESHLKECEACANKIEEKENRAFFKDNVIPDLVDARKIEARFTRRIAGKALTIIALIAIGFYAIFGLILPLAFNSINMEKRDELNYAVKDLIQFGIPGARLKGGYEGTTNLFDMITNIEYEQKTGGGGLKTGHMDLATPLYAGRNDWKISAVDTRQGSGFAFSYPQKRASSSVDAVMKKLEKIGAGTKTIAAIYFEEPVTTDTMKRLLDKIQAFDQDSWFSIDTGNAIKWQYDGDKIYRELRMFDPQWGFPMHMNLTPTIATSVTKNKNGNVTTISMGGGFQEHDVAAVGEQFKKEMKAFEGYSEKYFDAPEFTDDLKSLNKYIAANGIKFKGAIVGATTENILKLKDELNIARIDVVEVVFDY